jgi:hypothetical protein
MDAYQFDLEKLTHEDVAFVMAIAGNGSKLAAEFERMQGIIIKCTDGKFPPYKIMSVISEFVDAFSAAVNPQTPAG